MSRKLYRKVGEVESRSALDGAQGEKPAVEITTRPSEQYTRGEAKAGCSTAKLIHKTGELFGRNASEWNTSSEPTIGVYFNALRRAFRRDLYRAAVFSCSTPFWIALSKADVV